MYWQQHPSVNSKLFGLCRSNRNKLLSLIRYDWIHTWIRFVEKEGAISSCHFPEQSNALNKTWQNTALSGVWVDNLIHYCVTSPFVRSSSASFQSSWLVSKSFWIAFGRLCKTFCPIVYYCRDLEPDHPFRSLFPPCIFLYFCKGEQPWGQFTKPLEEFFWQRENSRGRQGL